MMSLLLFLQKQSLEVLAFTAKTPDPIPCALAALLLPELRAHGCHLFSGPAPHARGGLRARHVPTYRVRSCGVGGRRESERRPGCLEAVPGTAGRRRSLVESCSLWDAPGGGERVHGRWWAGRRFVFPRCGVGHALTLGLVRRLVALSGLLLWCPSRTLG